MVISPSPHLRRERDVAWIMERVLLALLPATFGGLYRYGPSALPVLAAALGGAVAGEAFWVVTIKCPKILRDRSCLVTGLLLALLLPPRLPWWMALAGGLFATGMVKGAFGGLGSNFLNPALAARALLLASWPVAMTTWVVSPDALASATPLAGAFPKETGLAAAHLSWMALFWSGGGGSLGETSPLAILLGAAYLLAIGVIDCRIPAGFLSTLAVGGWVLGGYNGLGSGDPLFQVVAGGALLGAFFMATDYVTAPVTRGGRWIYGLGCGALTLLIRLYGGYPEGVTYGVLLMNIAAPLLEKATRPRLYGDKGAVRR